MTVRIGIAGVGFMGMMHAYGVWGKHASRGRRVEGAQIVALATRNPVKLGGDWTSIQGNYGPRGGHENLLGVRTYTELDELIADEGVDLIHICLPNHLHRPVAVKALHAGKHVFVEKPIAVSLDEADEMLAAAADNDRHLMVAHVLPFMGAWAWALEAVQSGRFGRLLGGHFKRLLMRAVTPSDLARVAEFGGWGVDLHIHDTHFIQMLYGMPRRLFATGRLIAEKYLDYLSVQYLFGDEDLTVSCQCGAISAEARPFMSAFEIYLESATLAFDSASQPLTVYLADGRTEQVQLAESTAVDGFVSQIQRAVRVISEGADPGPLDARRARDALRTCLAEAESVRNQAPVDLG